MGPRVMADVELLPCPWCGDALHIVIVTEGSTPRWRKVDGCCADGPEVRHDAMADDQVAAREDSRRRAIEAWNSRANLAPLQAENERLLAERDALARDARRWRFCEERETMPVIASDGRTWCLFVPVTNRTRSLFRGGTASQAVDAAIAAANGGTNG